MKIERTIAAIFDRTTQANYVLSQLFNIGIPENRVGILMSGGTSDKEFVIEPRTKVFEGVAAGSTVGAVIGSLLGGLTAIGIPLTGGAALVAAGPLFASLAGMGLGSGLGGLSGALIGLGFEEYNGDLVERGVSSGHILLAVTVDQEQVDDVREIFEKNGGRNISVARRFRRDDQQPGYIAQGDLYE